MLYFLFDFRFSILTDRGELTYEQNYRQLLGLIKKLLCIAEWVTKMNKGFMFILIWSLVGLFLIMYFFR